MFWQFFWLRVLFCINQTLLDLYHQIGYTLDQEKGLQWVYFTHLLKDYDRKTYCSEKSWLNEDAILVLLGLASGSRSQSLLFDPHNYLGMLFSCRRVGCYCHAFPSTVFLWIHKDDQEILVWYQHLVSTSRLEKFDLLFACTITYLTLKIWQITTELLI